ncbi:predicted protein [Naegleria gruberi]|uniref:Predicted protein n=1 Tax=Naegleria gruberi TaxID=5762 RepID=D2VS21_NAEGR|nr:uncharacterized protein NAEGRDRAFT_71784 [Naegleria gruberi]EFC40270.1 predicted protein [Naegleria gruberi]|eukprot:XP_002673014.1 predicted protein [Naegleria gruberi strain NEG-M]
MTSPSLQSITSNLTETNNTPQQLESNLTIDNNSPPPQQTSREEELATALALEEQSKQQIATTSIIEKSSSPSAVEGKDEAISENDVEVNIVKVSPRSPKSPRRENSQKLIVEPSPSNVVAGNGAAAVNQSTTSLESTVGTESTPSEAASDPQKNLSNGNQKHNETYRKKSSKFPTAPKATHENNIGFFRSLKNYFLSMIYASQAQRQETKNNLTKSLELFEKSLNHMKQTNNNAADVSLLHYNMGIVWEKIYSIKLTAMLNASFSLDDHQNVATTKSFLLRDKTTETLTGQQKVDHLIEKDGPTENNTKEKKQKVDPEKLLETKPSIIVMDGELGEFTGRRTTVSGINYLTSVTAEEILSHLQSDYELDMFLEYEQAMTERFTEKDEISNAERATMIKNIFTHYAESLRLNPMHLETYFQLANMFQRVGLYYHAIALFEKTVEIQEEFSEGYNCLGVCLFNMGQLDKASYFYNKALKYDLKNPIIFANLGEVLYERGKFAEALNMFSRAFYLAPSLGSLYCYFGLYYLEQEKSKEKALQMFEKAMELSPTSGDVQFYYGRFWLEIEDYDKALTHFERASQLVPPNRQMYYYTGLALTKVGSKEEAISNLSKSVELAPTLDLYKETLEKVKAEV